MRSEHPAAGRSGTVSTADIEGSVGNWIEDIGQWPPPLTDEGAFYMGSTLNIVQVLHVGHCL